MSKKNGDSFSYLRQGQAAEQHARVKARKRICEFGTKWLPPHPPDADEAIDPVEIEDPEPRYERAHATQVLQQVEQSEEHEELHSLDCQCLDCNPMLQFA